MLLTKLWWGFRTWARKIHHWQRKIFAYLAVMTVISFSMFTLYECIKNILFASWIPMHAKAYYQSLYCAEAMDSMNNKLRIFNTAIGWLHPFAWGTYREYSKSVDIYTEMLRVGILKESPETLEGHMLIVHIKPESVTKSQDMLLILVPSLRLRIICDPSTQAFEPFEVKGLAKVREGWTTVDMRRQHD